MVGFKFCKKCGNGFNPAQVPTGVNLCPECYHKTHHDVMVSDNQVTDKEIEEIYNAQVTNEGLLLSDQDPYEEDNDYDDSYFDTDTSDEYVDFDTDDSIDDSDYDD